MTYDQLAHEIQESCSYAGLSIYACHMRQTSRGGLSMAVADARNTPRARTHLRNLGDKSPVQYGMEKARRKNLPLQSKFQEPNPTGLGIQSPSEGRERIDNIRILLNFGLEFSKGSQ